MLSELFLRGLELDLKWDIDKAFFNKLKECQKAFENTTIQMFSFQTFILKLVTLLSVLEVNC
jgi:hypothetical protein